MATERPADTHLTPALLTGGILASVTYVVTDLVAGVRYVGYSFTDQAVSELFAIGAPTSRIVVPLFTLSSVLLAAFGFGVWRSAGRTRSLRWAALMLFGNAVNSLVLWNFFPMHMRGVAPTFTDAMHLILAVNPFVLLSVVFVVVGCRRSFRLYSVATMLLMIATAVFGFSYASAAVTNQPTPGMGLAERMAQYGYDVWLAVFALVLLRQNKQRQEALRITAGGKSADRAA